MTRDEAIAFAFEHKDDPRRMGSTSFFPAARQPTNMFDVSGLGGIGGPVGRVAAAVPNFNFTIQTAAPTMGRLPIAPPAGVPTQIQNTDWRFQGFHGLTRPWGQTTGAPVPQRDINRFGFNFQNFINA